MEHKPTCLIFICICNPKPILCDGTYEDNQEDTVVKNDFKYLGEEDV